MLTEKDIDGDDKQILIKVLDVSQIGPELKSHFNFNLGLVLEFNVVYRIKNKGSNECRHVITSHVFDYSEHRYQRSPSFAKKCFDARDILCLGCEGCGH